MTMPTFHISDVTAADADTPLIDQIAALLKEAFQEHWPGAWENVDEAHAEVLESLEEGRISRVAVDNDSGQALGWIGAQHFYSEVWELHPLAVRVDLQRQGIGRALVVDLEEQVRQRGGLTLMLGTDDEDNMTTLSGVDLYPEPWRHMAALRDLRGHPFVFYQKLGYAVIGLVPDANGIGKPDILMAKRVG